MSTMSYIVSTFLLFMSVVYATPNSGPTLLPDHPSPVASTNLLEFLAVFEGDYSNKVQLAGEKKKTGQHHIPLNLHVIPVDIPAFSEDQRITALGREEANGAVYREELFEFIEEEAGIIHIKRYNLTGSSAYNNGPIEELQPEKLDTNPQCDGLFVKVEPAVYMMTLPDCRVNGEGKSHPGFVAVYTCSSAIIYTPAHALETSSALPYIFEKTGGYPLPAYLFQDKYSDYTYDFINPC